MLDNLTCEQKRMLYIAAAAAAAGAGGYAWKQTKGGLGGAVVGGVAAYLLLAACGPDTTGPTLAPTPDGTKTTVVAPIKGGTNIGLLPIKKPSGVAPSLLGKVASALADPALAVKQTLPGNIGGAGANCPSGFVWSDSRGSCIYPTNVR